MADPVRFAANNELALHMAPLLRAGRASPVLDNARLTLLVVSTAPAACGSSRQRNTSPPIRS